MKRVVVVLALLLVASSCAAPRSSLNTTASSCFGAIAAAEDAVHHKGRLVGVRHVETDSLAARVPEAAALGRRRVCAVAYRGDYEPGTVTSATSDRRGTYALILVDGSSRLLAAYVLAQLPVSFKHRD